MKSVIPFALALLATACAAPVVENNNNQEPGKKTSREVALTCYEVMFENYHIHPHISIYIDGQLQEIPANIGISYHCVKPIHTHDTTGRIHIESEEKMDFTLSDFFAVWGKTFTPMQILDSIVDSQHVIRFTVNGVPNTQYGNYVMKDLDNMVIRYERL